jgi:hypothetical protein
MLGFAGGYPILSHASQTALDESQTAQDESRTAEDKEDEEDEKYEFRTALDGSQILWVKEAEAEAIRIRTPGFNTPLTIIVSEGYFKVSNEPDDESFPIEPLYFASIPFKGEVRALGLPIQKRDPIFQHFPLAYPLKDVGTSFAHAYVVQNHDRSVLIIRFKFEGKSYDLFCHVPTSDRIDSVKVKARAMRGRTDYFTLQIRLDTQDDSIRGLYEVGLRKDQNHRITL